MYQFIQFLTYFRIISGPIIFLLILLPQNYGWALILLMLASATDFWDGYLARKYSFASEYGAVLDPIADKILITFVLIALSLCLESIYVALISSMMLAREFWVSALRDLNARGGKMNATKVTFLAKIKTLVQLLTLCLFLLGLFVNSPFTIFIAKFFLFAALIISIQTGLTYSLQTFSKLSLESIDLADRK
jgi:CDP-diacylglycerol---glycerol-3-phosphate 3-phosphatidyltransferase